jgi:4-hydroxybenzoate polyprenyltransferase
MDDPVPRSNAAPVYPAAAGAPESQRGLLLGLLWSMRPLQWPKNFLVFMPIAFTAGQAWQIADPASWLPLLGWGIAAFVAFCLVSAGEYLLNDVWDREGDRAHPRKRYRPIAAGQVPAALAVATAVVLFLAGLALAAWTRPLLGLVTAGYVVLLVAYSLKLKHVVVLDLLTVAAGFVLRAIAGAVAIAVPISPWLYTVTMLGALFIVINKRRHEILLLVDDAAQHRPILQEYSRELLDQMSSIVTASTLIAYGLYTFTAPNLPENHAMMLTVPFVLYGIFRYLYLVYQRDEGGTPEEILLRDRPLLINGLLWLITSVAILALFRQ